MTRTNEKRETLIAFKNIDVEITYYWDDHGKLINWNEHTDLPTSWKDVKVRLERYSFTDRVSLVRKKDFEIQQLVIDGKSFPGDVFDLEVTFGFGGKMTLLCKSVIGAG